MSEDKGGNGKAWVISVVSIAVGAVIALAATEGWKVVRDAPANVVRSEVVAEKLAEVKGKLAEIEKQLGEINRMVSGLETAAGQRWESHLTNLHGAGPNGRTRGAAAVDSEILSRLEEALDQLERVVKIVERHHGPTKPGTGGG